MTGPQEQDAPPRAGALANRVNQALLALAAREDRKRSEAELQTIATACRRAEDLTDQLGTTHQVAADLAVLGVPPIPPKVPASVAKAIPNLRSAATRAAVPSQDLADRLRGAAVQDALKAAEDSVKSCEQALAKAAEAERQRLYPADLDDPIPALPGGESLQARAGRIRTALGKRASSDVTELPPAIKQWRQAATDWENVRNEVRHAVEQLPPEIKAFVEAAAGREHGAPWSMVTPAVRAWLDSNGHGEGYEVRKW